jgi:hypothetical protein
MARKVDRKQHLRKGKKKVSVVHQHKTTVKDKKAKAKPVKSAEEIAKEAEAKRLAKEAAEKKKLRVGFKTAYSNDKYDVLNKMGKFHIVDKATGKTMAISEKPSVVKQFVSDGIDDFVGRKGFEHKEKVRKYRVKTPSKRGKSIVGKVENTRKEVETGVPEKGRQKGLPNRITKKLEQKKTRAVPRKLKKCDSPPRENREKHKWQYE